MREHELRNSFAKTKQMKGGGSNQYLYKQELII